MRDELVQKAHGELRFKAMHSSADYGSDSRSSQGLTHGKQKESRGNSKFGDLDRSASLTLARKGMKLKSKGGSAMNLSHSEVSERRQVGDAESIMDESTKGGRGPWWRNVTMEEGF